MTTLHERTFAENLVNLSFFSGVNDMDGQTSDSWDIRRVRGLRATSVSECALVPGSLVKDLKPGDALLDSGGREVGLVTCLLATKLRAISL